MFFVFCQHRWNLLTDMQFIQEHRTNKTICITFLQIELLIPFKNELLFFYFTGKRYHENVLALPKSGQEFINVFFIFRLNPTIAILVIDFYSSAHQYTEKAVNVTHASPTPHSRVSFSNTLPQTERLVITRLKILLQW